MSAAHLRALAFLSSRALKNRLRAFHRSPAFWVALGIPAIIFAIIAFGGRALPSERTLAGAPIDPSLWRSLIVAYTSVTILRAIWRGTRAVPIAAEESDLSLLMPAPIGARAWFGYRLVADNLARLWNLPVMAVLVYALPARSGHVSSLFILWMYLAVRAAGLIGRSLHFAIWCHVERLRGRAPHAARHVELGLRGFSAAAGIGLAVWLIASSMPAALLSGAGEGTTWIDRLGAPLLALDRFPPVSWVAALVPASSLGTPPAGALALVGAAVLCLQLAAVAGATDYYEPLVLQAERFGAILRRSRSSDSDPQGAALQMLRAQARRTISVPPFGQGPTAFLWIGCTRWVRYSLATMTLSLAAMLLVGLIIGGAVRWFGASAVWAWGAPAFLAALTGSASYLTDELRRPHLFLIPGSGWHKLLAAGAIGGLDALISGVILIAVLIPLVPLTAVQTTAAALMLCGAIIVSQSATACAQLTLPIRLRGGLRSLIVTGIMGLASAPGLALLAMPVFKGESAVSAVPQALAAFAVSGAVCYITASTRFKRAEMG